MTPKNLLLGAGLLSVCILGGVTWMAYSRHQDTVDRIAEEAAGLYGSNPVVVDRIGPGASLTLGTFEAANTEAKLVLLATGSKAHGEVRVRVLQTENGYEFVQPVLHIDGEEPILLPE